MLRFLLPVILTLVVAKASRAQVPMNEQVESLPPPTNHSTDSVYEKPEVKADFPGGQSSMLKYVSKNLVYPESAIENGISGSIFISFIVEKDGFLTHVELAKANKNKDLVNEALRVVSMFPKFNPALQNGIPVRSKIVLPINFLLE